MARIDELWMMESLIALGKSSTDVKSRWIVKLGNQWAFFLSITQKVARNQSARFDCWNRQNRSKTKTETETKHWLRRMPTGGKMAAGCEFLPSANHGTWKYFSSATMAKRTVKWNLRARMIKYSSLALSKTGNNLMKLDRKWSIRSKTGRRMGGKMIT